MKIHSFLIFMTLLNFGCYRKSLTNQINHQDDIIRIERMNCLEVNIGQGFDSKVKKLQCGDITIQYDYGVFANKGPISTKEHFIQTFRGYHFQKFFENIHMDQKVFKIFRDSVTVVDAIDKKLISNELVFDCSQCNAVAHLLFKNHDFYFPFTCNNDFLITDQMYEFQYGTLKNGNLRKDFWKKDGSEGGIYIQDPNPQGNHLSLKVTGTTNLAQLKEILISNISIRSN